jgi:PAS domain S-box-containing protein
MIKSPSVIARDLNLSTRERFSSLLPKERGSIQHYFLAAVLIALALWIRLAIAPIQAGYQYLTFFPAVAIAAVVGGYRVGLFTLIVALAIATYIFTPPYYSFSLEVFRSSLWTNLVFLMDGVVVSFSIEAMHRYRKKYQDKFTVATESEQRVLKLNQELAEQIAERKKNESALRESKERLRLFIEHAPAALAMFDRQMRYLAVSRRWMVDYVLTEDDIIGRSNYDIFPTLPERWRALFNRGMGGEVLRSEEDFFARRDGTFRCLTWEIRPWRTSDGAIGGIVIFSEDITERKRGEDALKQALSKLETKELAKTRFLAAAGHDLRQPVAAASMYIDALKLAGANPRQMEIIRRLSQSMATFNGLLDALLNVSKLDAGMVKADYAAIHVHELFNWLSQNFEPLTSKKNLAFRMYFPLGESLIVRSDDGLLRSVLMNLVNNAIKFTSHGGILVSARRRGQAVLFQVWDTGIGIPVEHIGHIFEEFYQIHNMQRDRAKGLGLGLSIVKRGLMLLGEDVKCRSKVGRGSVFEFRLPLDSGFGKMLQGTTFVPAEGEELDLEFTRGKRFVVVEDDTQVATAVTDVLQGMGAEVTHFYNAEDALRHVNLEYADCYIVDHMLGGRLNGIQFLNRVGQKLGKPIKAVLVTGDTSAAFMRHAAECAWPVLHKPTNMAKLISALISQGHGSNESIKSAVIR